MTFQEKKANVNWSGWILPDDIVLTYPTSYL